ncbi:hypothetical protein EIP91_001702 [Steccherinum ochraceum]|uniref:F-box domain-containing protein n=1 Tax=Steccherinum ochraceum TaxID=92696 RepID=A0A4R0RQQ1_9APHY|nr:hypothetical protein EIP91_001702 [Steccherinum ochraceum]
MASATFASLPVEIVYPIFSYACTPDSYYHSRPLGPALNLVSRAFRDICLTYGPDVEHVAIRRVPSMATFAILLSQRNIHAKRVRSLLLEESTVWRTLTKFAVDFITEILKSINPFYLRTLFISLSSPPRGHNDTIPTIALPARFPVLSVIFLSKVLVISPMGHQPRSPMLKCMQILDLAADSSPDMDLGEELTRLAPSLRRIKFSVLPSSSTAELLTSALDALVPPHTDDYKKSIQSDILHIPPQVVLAYLPYYVPTVSGTSRVAPIVYTESARSYDAGVRLVWLQHRIPRDPVIKWPTPAIRHTDVYKEDERRKREAFWADWMACVAGKKVVWT